MSLIQERAEGRSAPDFCVGRPDAPAARWLGSWRLCLRLAVRDLRRARWRTALGIATIVLPLMVIAAVGVFFTSQQPAPAAMVSADMGSGQALLAKGSTDGMTFPSVWYAQDGVFAARSGQFDRTGLEQVVHGRLLPTGSAQVTVRSGGVLANGTSVRIGTDPGYDGMATLTSGRWPTSSDEVLLGGLGLASGLPTHGTVDIVDTTDSVSVVRSLQVVGTVRTTAPVLLVELPDARTATSWILLWNKPVDEQEAVGLTRCGVSVASRDLVANSRTTASGDQGVVTLIVSMLTVGIVVVIAAMVAPVFAVGAARSRRAVALLAGNGATTAQRRRYVLSQALLVGVAAAVLAPVAGALLGAVALLIYRQHHPGAWAGPVVVPWPWGLLMAGVAIAAALIAALLPAIAASRRPVVSSLAVNPTPSARGGIAVAGLLIGALSSVLVWRGVQDALRGPMNSPAGAAVPLTGGGIALFGGALMLVPWLMGRLGALASQLPVAPRLALRDLARQRTRATAVVGSVLATVGVMIAVLIPLTSQRASQIYTYQPAIPPGDVRVVAPSDADEAVIRRVVATVVPGAEVIPMITAPPETVGIEGLSQDTVVGSPDQLAQVYRLTAQQHAMLRQGGLVLSPDGARPAGLRTETGTVTVRGALQLPYVFAGDRLSLVPINPHAVEIHRLPDTGVLMPLAVAQRLGVDVGTGTYLIHGGDLDDGAADRLQSGLGTYGVTVDHPDTPIHTPDLRLPVLGVGAVLLLLAIASGTFLAQSDRRGEDTIVQRLGAGRGLRRRVNAWWAAAATFVGVGVGLVAGWLPGTAMAVEARSRAEMYAAPWGIVFVLLFGAPLLAAALAAAFTRRTPAEAGFRRRRHRLR
ncbi:FtsX-like permease family protein [Branchiibius sp. NY16-3462-2]|uniref:FtsX-like permease family protein n=1 Tax=Branchiibius sp. NY16-3462-2 TaxID=1807500 RepID=UPI00079B60A3|nr:FtsX-like permease family protein [Branchiibius sp. NY16-3462-2]KYH45973.1 hypothetical protein AZH51_09935 [Branchiibius sp. NY16-3462-2]